MKLGLRIDVDTFRGTRDGVPALCATLNQQGLKASFFFSVGPDNMGRHLWRLIRPAFLIKMLRSHAASLYGWDILFKGTLWPGPHIGQRLRHIIRATAQAGHEIGLHAWDHHAWQAHVDHMSADDVRHAIQAGEHALADILGAPPTCSAAPGWKATPAVIEAKAGFSFLYNSDCRGYGIFRPVSDGAFSPQIQIPTTLPTYDEIIGRNSITDNTYNEHLLSLLRKDRLNVLTIHAEVEGIARKDLFARFLDLIADRNVDIAPLGALLREQKGPIPSGRIVQSEIAGREGWVACQENPA